MTTTDDRYKERRMKGLIWDNPRDVQRDAHLAEASSQARSILPLYFWKEGSDTPAVWKHESEEGYPHATALMR